jgi:hypothetical protein
MKCAIAFSVLLAGCSTLLGDPPNASPPPRATASTLLEDLVRMTRAASSDAAVLAYARAHRVELPAELPDSSLRWLRASGVSERVVRYMSAIDVRASTPTTPEGVTCADENSDASRRAYVSEEESDRGEVTERLANRDSGRSYDTEAYAGYDSDAGDYGDGYGYRYAYEPYFGYPYLSAPYFSDPFVDRGDFFLRFRDHRKHGGHGSPRFDGGGGRSRDRRGSRGAWRDRGSGGRAMGPRNSGRSFAGGGFRGARGGARTVGPRGFAPPRSARGSFSPGFGGSRSHETRGFGNPAPFRGPLPRSHGGFSRGSTAASRGGRGRS